MALASTVSPSSSNQQGIPRRLSELLKEQQEPFILEIYLLERGCRKKSLEIQGNHSCNVKSSKFFKKSSYHGPNIARTLYNKIISINKILKSKKKGRRRHKEAVESETCSSASCSTLSNSWSESDTDGDQSISSPIKNANEENYSSSQAARDRVTNQWTLTEETKQCSPVSVLDEIDLLQAIPVYNVRQDQETPTASRICRYEKKVSEDSILSASLWELLIQSRKQKPKKPGRKSIPQYINSKKALQQTRQLLFDCVREVVDCQNSQKIKKDRGLMGPEEIGKIICNNLKTWGKISADETNINKLLRTDLLSGSAEEWGGFQMWKPEIVMEIGNAIVDQITDEIVRDMIYLD